MAMPLGSSFSSATSTGKQAGVGLLLAETENSNLIVVKQVVPRGSADRSGRVRVGDHILRVAGIDATSGMGVTDLRNLIVGEQGTRVSILFRRADSGEQIELDLVRGSPEFLDMGHVSSHPVVYHHSMSGSMGGGAAGSTSFHGQRSLYGSGGQAMHAQPIQPKYTLGTSWSAEMFKQLPPPQSSYARRDATSSLQEENEWLRSALRMAEGTVSKIKQDLASTRDMFVKHKVEAEGMLKQMESNNRAKDDERREAEQALLAAEEYRRGLEMRLRETQRRSDWIRETEEQISRNQQERLTYIAEVNRRADSEKRDLEQELMRLNDDLRTEKVARSEAEQREVSLRSDFNRLSEHRQQEGRGSYPDTRSSYDTNIGDSFATAQLGHYTMGQGADKARVVSIPSSDVAGLASRSAGAVSSELMLA